MNAIFRLILLFLILFVAGQTWGISVTQHQYDAEDVTHDVNEYVYDATINLHVCCGDLSIEPQAQDAQDRYFLALISDFVVTKSGTTVIGRVKDLQNLKKGEQSLLNRLPDRGSAKANWKQNSGVIRQEISKGKPIRDASPGDKRGQFLNAERNLLESRGWTFDKSSSFWNPPKP